MLLQTKKEQSLFSEIRIQERFYLVQENLLTAKVQHNMQ